MALISLRQLLDHAAENGYGVPAFNVNNLEQVRAIMAAAEAESAPVIVQASRGAREYAGDIYLRRMMQAAVETHPRIPVCMHLDHGNNPQTCASAMASNFTSVMMDGSLREDAKTPADYAYNVAVTKQVCQMAHLIGVSVEGELGCLGSLETGGGEAEDGHGFEGALPRERLLTNPAEAEQFVKETQVDALAVAVGTSHGAYKFSRRPDGDILAIDVIKKIHARLPRTHLVMHGSSSVPQELQDIINAAGGEMPQTFGVPVEEIAEGIKHGVRKINIDTDCRMAMTGQYRKIAKDHPAEFDPRKFNKPAMAKMTEICRQRLAAFNTSGNAQKITPLPLAEMAKKYAKGEMAH
ncbi:MAG: class II fructose-bisphosphate aldolase [Gammaproteobacteria bacterium]